eukprot:111613-Chlamydomonas_euryale.AAC.1
MLRLSWAAGEGRPIELPETRCCRSEALAPRFASAPGAAGFGLRFGLTGLISGSVGEAPQVGACWEGETRTGGGRQAGGNACRGGLGMCRG